MAISERFSMPIRLRAARRSLIRSCNAPAPMRVLTFFFLVLPAGAWAQTTVYLRGSGPAGVTVKGATNTTPVVIQTATPHNLAVGDTVSIWGVCGTTTANGTRKVKAVVDPTHFSITDLNGSDIAGNGAWCTGSIP